MRPNKKRHRVRLPLDAANLRLKRNGKSVEGNLGGFCVASHALVFVRLTHDRRFVVGVLFLFVVVLVVFIRVSGRHHVAHDYEGMRGVVLVRNADRGEDMGARRFF